MSTATSPEPQDEDTDRVADLVARWQNGDQAAPTAMFNRYVGSLLGVARNHLSSRLAENTTSSGK